MQESSDVYHPARYDPIKLGPSWHEMYNEYRASPRVQLSTHDPTRP